MGKHTPGGWHRNIRPAKKYATIFAGRNTHVAVLCTTGLSDEEVEANADLISAAPELLAFVEHVKTLAFDFINEGIRPQDHHMRELAWKANAVAAKATGESHG